MLVRFMVSNAILLFLPSKRRVSTLQIEGDRRARHRAIDDYATYVPKVAYRPPFDGEWYVLNGGLSEADSHSWDLAGQRYAYDFVVVDEHRRQWRAGSRGKYVEDYLCHDQPILAPADGVVVAAEDGSRETPRPGTGWLDPSSEDPRGNFVVLRHTEEEYSLLAHLAPDSIGVREGQAVRAGQYLGRCGNSGNSTQPHLHFQIQDREDFFEAASLPVAFCGVSVEKGAIEDGVYLTRGQRLLRA